MVTVDGRSPNTMRSIAIGAAVASANTNLNQLVAASGTNTGTHGASTFQLTGVDTTLAISFARYQLEITQASYLQVRRIASNTAANPGVATIEGVFSPVLSGNQTYLVYPLIENGLVITPDVGMTGTLTIYRANGDSNSNKLAVLRAGDPAIILTISNPSKVYYKFSVNAGTEVFYWREGA